MEYFIFDFNRDDGLIDSLLDSSSIAHDIPKKTREWFYWKFRDNPYGRSVLSCVKNGDHVIGCVAYGMHIVKYYEEEYNGALSFENFVHPEYQGKGIFGRLLKNAECELRRKGVQLLYNFPNSKSLPGFLKAGWEKIDVSETWMKVVKYRRLGKVILGLRCDFIPFGNDHQDDILELYQQNNLDDFCFVVSLDYLRWRFFVYPNSRYLIINNSIYFAVVRIGKRGEVREAQVLYVNIYDQRAYNPYLFIREVSGTSGCDIITVPLSKKNRYKKYLYPLGFFRVPNRTNVCYKVLDEDVDLDARNITLYGINYHTY